MKVDCAIQVLDNEEVHTTGRTRSANKRKPINEDVEDDEYSDVFPKKPRKTMTNTKNNSNLPKKSFSNKPELNPKKTNTCDINSNLDQSEKENDVDGNDDIGKHQSKYSSNYFY